MDRLAIEINGAGLLVTDSHKVLASEPGYAIVDDARAITGSAAYGQARLQPANARIGFWSGLSVAGGAAQSHAELAYEHLKLVWQQAGHPNAAAVLIVPGGYDAEQLGLVLGIAHECGIQVEAMVDAAVAASALRYEDRQLLHIDASLRTVSASRIGQSEAATVEASETSQATGLADFTDAMVRAIARVFVLETRVDPLHNAETEQRLYDGLPEWLAALDRDGSARAEIEHAGEAVTVELTIERVRSASLRLFREIARLISELRTPNVPAVVQLSDRLATLPGLRTELERIDGIIPVVLDHGFPATSALGRIENSSAATDEVRLLRRLPFAGAGELPAALPQSAATARNSVVLPTHIVFEGIGYRLGSGAIEVANAAPASSANGTLTIPIGDRGGAAGGAHCILLFEDGRLAVQRTGGTALLVNEQPVQPGHLLEIGDTMRVGDPFAELHVVALEEE